MTFSLEKPDFSGVTKIKFPYRTYTNKMKIEGKKEGEVIYNDQISPNLKFPVKIPLKGKWDHDQKFKPKANISTLAMIASKGSQILDHFAMAARNGDDESNFPGTFTGHPGAFIGLEGLHCFDAKSADQAKIVRLLRAYKKRWDDGHRVAVRWRERLSSEERDMLDFGLYRYKTVTNKDFLNEESHPMVRYMLSPTEEGLKSDIIDLPFSYKSQGEKDRV